MEVSVAGQEIYVVEEHVNIDFALNEFLHIKVKDGPGHFVSLVAVDEAHFQVALKLGIAVEKRHLCLKDPLFVFEHGVVSLLVIAARCKVESNIVIVLSEAFRYGQVSHSEPLTELVFDSLFTLSELDVFEDQVFILSIREVEELHLAS